RVIGPAFDGEDDLVALGVPAGLHRAHLHRLGAGLAAARVVGEIAGDVVALPIGVDSIDIAPGEGAEREPLGLDRQVGAEEHASSSDAAIKGTMPAAINPFDSPARPAC